MRTTALVLLLAVVVMATSAWMPAVSDATERVFETAEAFGEFIDGIAQIGGDLLSLARDVPEWLETWGEDLERLMDMAESGMSLVNRAVERVAPSP
ncbi:hypothetical protein FKB36_04465 [Methanoculleus sp. Afa-1]|uniref:Uncharacterized protein n=1 Tax=Methanoculleus formosensis TaxID=2590886 RepID=A0A9E4ZKD2_9EURY|nr:hypothetical protein [Methanoculleus sp. Afa-1]MCT8336759.1 hypothetical protein [Methanoculleus sp. Afa-1]